LHADAVPACRLDVADTTPTPRLAPGVASAGAVTGHAKAVGVRRPLDVDAPTVGEEGCFGPVHTDPSTPSGDTHQTVDDDFTMAVVCKRDSPLIHEPPKQPPAKPVLPWRSRRLAARSLSRVSASKAMFSSPIWHQILLCKKKIPRHIKMPAHTWSTKCR
jgi:hypothetical protein